MIECRIDFETRSDIDLRTRGAGPYFASPHFAALGASYRIGTGPLMDWEMYQPMPDDLREHVRSGGLVRAWNASFERQCFRQLAIRHGWAEPKIEQYRCTAAEAAAMGLPRSLDMAGRALGLEIQKDKRGSSLIGFFSVPDRYKIGVVFNEPKDHPEKYQEFIEYRRRDVLTEEAAAARIIPLSDYEQRVYALDQIINDRGIRIDAKSAAAAVRLVEAEKKHLDDAMAEVTAGAVRACSQVASLVTWVHQQGVSLDSAAKAEITALLAAVDLPDNVRRALEIRQEAAKTSTAKLETMLERADRDGRVRGTQLIYGASTGRWTSVGVNFNNLPRPRRIYEDAKLNTRTLFKAIRTGEPGVLPMLYGPELGRPLHLVSDAIRGFLWAGPGNDLLQADYTSIEGAVIAWSSGEQWKVDAMHAIMADPSIPDLYRQTAAAIMGMSTDEITKKHPLRQSVGKVSELALGFGGGVAAFYAMANGYGVNLDQLFAPVWASADEERREKAVRRYKANAKRGRERANEMSEQAWIACELIKTGWRAANPAIAAGWRLREEAMRQAILNPGEITSALKFRYLVRNGFLWALLPSGRALAYGKPQLSGQCWVKVKLPDGSWSDDSEIMGVQEARFLEQKGDAKIEGDAAPAITALGVGENKQWMRFNLYGGLAAENDTQATARDLLVNGMLKAEQHGYPIVAHVYDEIICEVPRGFGDLKHFEKVICELPEWAAGLPLSASGWRGKRYRKD